MEAVYQLGNLRVVDLTKVLDPATESRRCHLIRYNTGGPIPDYHTALDLTSHLGTHCECPYHHFEDGKSVGDLPLTTFMGRAIYVNIDFLEPNAHISAADLDRACGDRIQEGDIVILDSNWKFPPFTPASNSRSACCMTDVNISFDDSERSTGVIESGTITETGLDLDPSIDGVARPMAGWTCRVHRD